MVMHLLADNKRGAVPVLIKVQQLQRRLLSDEDRPTFAAAWNWIDAFLRCEHGAGSEVYLALRQAMMARRTILLLDGARPHTLPAAACPGAAFQRALTQVRSLSPFCCKQASTRAARHGRRSSGTWRASSHRRGTPCSSPRARVG